MSLAILRAVPYSTCLTRDALFSAWSATLTAASACLRAGTDPLFSCMSRFLHQQPLTHPSVSDKHLALWYFEDEVKRQYMAFIGGLEVLRITLPPHSHSPCWILALRPFGCLLCMSKTAHTCWLVWLNAPTNLTSSADSEPRYRACGQEQGHQGVCGAAHRQAGAGEEPAWDASEQDGMCRKLSPSRTPPDVSLGTNLVTDDVCGCPLTRGAARSGSQGDNEKKLASKVVYLLSNVVDTHPNMKMPVARELQQLIFRPNIKPRAQYYGVLLAHSCCVRCVCSDLHLGTP